MKEKFQIRKIKKGDQDALNAFIQDVYPPIYRYVYCKVSGKEEAKDITQDVFYRFVRQLSTYDWDGNVLAYLYTIASNCCASYYKKTKRFDCIELIEELAAEEPATYQLLDQLQLEELKLLLLRLPPIDQDIIIFHYVKQMTFKEIAHILAEHEGTIKTRHYRSLHKIRKLWKEVNPDDSTR